MCRERTATGVDHIDSGLVVSTDRRWSVLRKSKFAEIRTKAFRDSGSFNSGKELRFGARGCSDGLSVTPVGNDSTSKQKTGMHRKKRNHPLHSTWLSIFLAWLFLWKIPLLSQKRVNRRIRSAPITRERTRIQLVTAHSLTFQPSCRHQTWLVQ
jgi:hypothetical protein